MLPGPTSIIGLGIFAPNLKEMIVHIFGVIMQIDTYILKQILMVSNAYVDELFYPK